MDCLDPSELQHRKTWINIILITASTTTCRGYCQLSGKNPCQNPRYRHEDLVSLLIPGKSDQVKEVYVFLRDMWVSPRAFLLGTRTAWF